MANAKTPNIGKGYNLPEDTDKIMSRPVVKVTKPKEPRRPPLWRRGAGIGKSAVWVEALGQYVISRNGKINLGHGSWRA